MTETKTVASESFEFKAEVQQLLNILVHSLYTEKEIFLRELISNASDAINRIQFEMLTNRDVLDAETELGIWISTDEEANTLTIRDTGIGMTRDEVISNLGTIAKSGAADFLTKLKDNKDQIGNIIGQFGVGFYSVFMVAKEVEVITRSYQKDAQAVKWVSTGSGTYTIEDADKAERGTTIIIKLNEDDKEFSATYRIQNVVKKHSDFVTYPIYVGDEENSANQQKALWRQSSSEIDEEKYNDFYKQLTLDFEAPLAHLHLSVDAPVQVNALLYLPAKREGSMFSLRKDPGLKLYCNNVLIQEYTTDLLPNHFRFMHGVVDSEDLSLSVSREAVQNTRTIEKLKNLLTKRVVRMLETLDKKDSDKYAAFWAEFGPFIKEGIATDFSAKDTLTKLLRFRSSTTEEDKLVSMKDYVEAMPDTQDKIYYILADSLAAAKNSPHMDYFKKNNIQVLYMVDPMDSFMLSSFKEFGGHTLQNVDTAELETSEEDAAAKAEAKSKLPDDRFANIVARFKTVLGERTEDIREAEHLTNSPVRLVAPEGQQGQEMDRVRRILDKDFEIPKRILEINRGHKIIQNLDTMIGNNTALADTVMEQLFANALLSEGLHPNPAEMLPQIQSIIEAATS